MARGGWCVKLHLREDNARFILLAICLIIYMLLGAVMFMLLEGPNEKTEKEIGKKEVKKFFDLYPDVNATDLQVLLDAYAEAATAGYLPGKRDRWDFSGSFYFVGTVVSTIGKLT